MVLDELDHLRRGDLEYAVLGDARLELDLAGALECGGGGCVGGRHTADEELADARVAERYGVGKAVAGLDLERVALVDGEQLAERGLLEARKDLELVVVRLGALPAQRDRKELTVLDLELLDLERRTEYGAHERGAARTRLVRVQRRARLLGEHVADDLLDGGYARRAADDLDQVDVGRSELSRREQLEQGLADARQQLLRQRLELVALHTARHVHVVHEALDVERYGRRVGRHELLELLALGTQAQASARIRVRVHARIASLFLFLLLLLLFEIFKSSTPRFVR